MAWRLEYARDAQRQIDRLDSSVRARILTTLDMIVLRNGAPRASGGALTGDLAGLWRYRVGDWRVLCRIEDERVTVLVLKVDHRSRVY